MSENNVNVFWLNYLLLEFRTFGWLSQLRFWSTDEIISGKVLKFGNVLKSPVWLNWPPFNILIFILL